MRKKYVRPFLTIKDFRGAILVGFLAAYTGQQKFQQLASFLTHSANKYSYTVSILEFKIYYRYACILAFSVNVYGLEKGNMKV
jgi:hypothetical protein